MTPDDPRHGRYAGYQEHRDEGSDVCDPCNQARYRYQKGLELDHNRGIYRRVDPTPAREHFLRLRAAGVSPKDIADRAGVAETTVHDIFRKTLINRDTAAAIIGVPVPASPGRIGYLPRRGVVRRLRALIAIGWTNSQLADHLGVSRQRLSNLTNDQASRPETAVWVQAPTWHAVADMYRDLAMKPGSSETSRNHAAAQGWAPPLAWDDIDLDDSPSHDGWAPRNLTSPFDTKEYDEVVVLRLLDGDTTVPATKPERVEAMRRWRSWGGSEKSFCELHGWKPGRYSRVTGAAA